MTAYRDDEAGRLLRELEKRLAGPPAPPWQTVRSVVTLIVVGFLIGISWPMPTPPARHGYAPKTYGVHRSGVAGDGYYAVSAQRKECISLGLPPYCPEGRLW